MSEARTKAESRAEAEREAKITQALETAARDRGAISVDVVAKLADRALASISEDGEVVGAATAVARLEVEAPGYFRPRRPGGTPPIKPFHGGSPGVDGGEVAIRTALVRSGRYHTW